MTEHQRLLHDTIKTLGACALPEVNPDLFHAPERERQPERVERTKKAKQVCARCDVVDECREYVFSVDDRFGIWAGLTEDDRKAMRQEDEL